MIFSKVLKLTMWLTLHTGMAWNGSKIGETNKAKENKTDSSEVSWKRRFWNRSCIWAYDNSTLPEYFLLGNKAKWKLQGVFRSLESMELRNRIITLEPRIVIQLNYWMMILCYLSIEKIKILFFFSKHMLNWSSKYTFFK